MWKWIFLVLILMYVFRRWIFMFLMTFLVRKIEKKIQKFAQQAQNQADSTQNVNTYQQGDFSFDIPSNQQKKKNSNIQNDDDFVDFEEVK